MLCLVISVLRIIRWWIIFSLVLYLLSFGFFRRWGIILLMVNCLFFVRVRFRFVLLRWLVMRSGRSLVRCILVSWGLVCCVCFVSSWRCWSWGCWCWMRLRLIWRIMLRRRCCCLGLWSFWIRIFMLLGGWFRSWWMRFIRRR